MISKTTSHTVLKLMMMVIMTLPGLLHAEDVTLSGTVKDIKGNPLEGVSVKLTGMKDLSGETKNDGSFTVTNVTSVLLPQDLKASYGISFRNNAIIFTNVPEKISGKIALYSINGRLISSITLDNLSIGQQSLVLPRVSSGTYLLAGTVNGKSFTRSLLCSGNDRLKSKASAQAETKANRSFNLSKRAAVELVDTLIFSKDGYTTQRWPLNSFSRENIRMVLRAPGEKPVVFMTKKLGPEGFLAIYEAIGYDLPGEIMVKVHNGEQGGKYFISSGRMASLVNQVNGTIVETCLEFSMNGFFRDTPARNLQISKDHGFDTIGQGVDILDTDGEIPLTVVGGTQLGGKSYVGANFAKYQSSLVISHFKGHGIAGFGGAIKNIGIGFASPEGKGLIHSGGKTKGTGTGIWTQDNGLFQKAMVEASKAVLDALEENLVYINTVDNLTLECDCDVAMGQTTPEMGDIGMLGSLDPIAIDQASCDLVLAAEGGQKLKDRINSTKLKGLDGLKYGAEIGLGKTEYELINIDE